MKRLVLCSVALIVVFSAPAAHAESGGRISVGTNVHVSAGDSQYTIGEVFLVADPANADHLLACGVVYGYAQHQNKRWTIVYVSDDRGKTWTPTLRTNEWADSADPACTLAPNNVASHVTLELKDANYYSMAVYNSRDGGHTWTKDPDIPMKFQGIDNEFMTADATDGPHRGSIYIGGESSIRTFGDKFYSGYGLWRSTDGGRSYERPIKRAPDEHCYVLGIGDLKVMRDGTIVMIFGDLLNSNGNTVDRASPGHPNATLDVMTSSDGGDSLSPVTKAADYYMSWAGAPTDSEPSLAVDNTDGVFANRLYAVIADLRSGRSAIYVIHSDDKGKTWSQPLLVDDDIADADPATEPNNFMPTIAVNRNGVVGVAWYDRRDFPKNNGWQLRFAASFDGGDTWTPSVPVEAVPNRYTGSEYIGVAASGTRDQHSMGGAEKGRISLTVFPNGREFNAGDYAGLVADAAGMFHALWIDNRTGMPQIWTAPISVEGAAMRFGSPELSDYANLSDDISLFVDGADWNRLTNDVTVIVHVKNGSKSTLHGPFRLRIISLQSLVAGVARIENSANGLDGPGVVINLDSVIPNGVLHPGGESQPLVLHVHLSRVWPLQFTSTTPSQVVQVNAELLGHR